MEFSSFLNFPNSEKLKIGRERLFIKFNVGIHEVKHPINTIIHKYVDMYICLTRIQNFGHQERNILCAHTCKKLNFTLLVQPFVNHSHGVLPMSVFMDVYM